MFLISMFTKPFMRPINFCDMILFVAWHTIKLDLISSLSIEPYILKHLTYNCSIVWSEKFSEIFVLSSNLIVFRVFFYFPNNIDSLPPSSVVLVDKDLQQEDTKIKKFTENLSFSFSIHLRFT